ncbi:MAG: hypothetical protein M0C28_13440 [Candidatus Moduliflexus flocculans]|nr:hypothetical protein [Candidatus Moduliflexus flocculans]
MAHSRRNSGLGTGVALITPATACGRTATRGIPARSARIVHQLRARGSAAMIARTPSAWPKPNSNNSQPPGAQRGGGLRRPGAGSTSRPSSPAVQRLQRFVIPDLRLQAGDVRRRARRAGSRRRRRRAPSRRPAGPP